MNKLYPYLALLVSLLSLPVLAQSTSGSTATSKNTSFNTVKTFTPPAPEMAAFQRYGDLPVNYNTGVPSISIPLGEISLRGFSWPVSLSYHAGGNKVNEFASNVGLGWTLQAGGSVSAKVIGESDEQQAETFYKYFNLGHPNHPNGRYFSDQCTNDSFYNPQDVYDADQVIRGGQLFMHDIYYISTAKDNFRMVDNITVPVTDNRITREQQPNGVTAYIMTDPQGNRYTFGRKTETLRTASCTGGPTPTGSTTSTYYLTRVDTYLGEYLVFEYDQLSYTYTDMPSEIRKAPAAGSCSRCWEADLLAVTCNYTVHTTELQLKSISSSDDQFVEFKYGPREDNPGSKRLARVNFYEWGRGRNYKKYSYRLDNRHYFGGAIGSDNVGNRRLKLEKVKRIAGGDSTQVHSFTYDPTSLPPRTSTAIDKMGYYAGGSGGSMLDAQDNVSNYNYVKASIMTGITYPTGGSTTFSYELNPGGWSGLRVTQIQDRDFNGTVVKTKSYQYDAPNLNLVKFERMNAQYFLGVLPSGYYDEAAPNTNGIIECSIVTRQSSPVVEYMENWIDNSLSYTTVTETFDDATVVGRYGKHVYKYNTLLETHGRSGVLSLSPMLTEKETYRKTATGYTMVRKEDSFYALTPDPYQGNNPADPNYHQVPVNNREHRIFMKQLELLRQDMSIPHNASGEIYMPFVYCFPKMFLQVDHYRDVPAVYLVKQVTTDIKENGTSFVSTVNYSYDHTAGDLQPTQILTVGSNGVQEKEEIRYTRSNLSSLTLLPEEPEALAALNNANVVAPVWKRISSGNTPTFENQVRYKLFTGKALAWQEEVMPTGATFKKVHTVNRYEKNNAVEVQPHGQQPVAYRFNFRGELIAACVNATYNQFAFTSFSWGVTSAADEGFEYNFSSVVRYDSATHTADPHVFYTGRLSGASFFRSSYNLANAAKVTKKALGSGRYIVAGYIKNATIAIEVNGSPVLGTAAMQDVGNGWSYFEKEIEVGATPADVLIGGTPTGAGTALLDELRLYPAGAQLTTYGYESFLNRTSFVTDPNGKTAFYEYDAFGRLKYVRDQDGNILNRYDYIYRN